LGGKQRWHLRKKGIDVVLTYNTNKEAADKVVAEFQSLGTKQLCFSIDTSNIKTVLILLSRNN